VNRQKRRKNINVRVPEVIEVESVRDIK